MTTYNSTPYTTQSFYAVQQAKGYLEIATFGGVAVAAASASNVHAAITTAVITTTGITNPVTPRVARIVSGGGSHNATGNVVITGTDVRNSVITDTIALNGNTNVDGVKAFKTITAIDTTGVSGIGASATVTVGVGLALGLGRLQTYASPLFANVDGVADSGLPTMTKSSTDISQNTATPATAPNGSHTYVIGYMTTDLYAG